MTQTAAEVGKVTVTAFKICDSCDRTFPFRYTSCINCQERLRSEENIAQRTSVEPDVIPIENIWTLEYLIDQLYLHLWVVEEIYDEKVHSRKYQAQAQALMYKIPVYRPVPAFIVNLSDLPEYIIKKLEACDKQGCDYVIKSAVGRIFETINLEYYALSVARSLVVRLER